MKALPIRGTTATVTEFLKGAIAAGRLRPGEPIRQEQLAQDLGVSHIPVREALRQLVSEGLVTATHNRGMAVSSLTEAEAWELIEYRTLLESWLARKSVPLLTADDLRQAGRLIDEMDSAKSVQKVFEINAEFHRCIYRRADAPYFMRAVEQARINLGRYLLTSWQQPGHSEKSQDDHREILAACARGDGDEAGRLIEQHVHAIGGAIVSEIRAQASA